jgi:hypothetical protein
MSDSRTRHATQESGHISGPDFFIVGAPKCGTTALSEYLREHPNICFSATKEPHFFADDFPIHRLDLSLSSYWRRNFSHYDPARHAVVGEGSALYYLSEVAVHRILALNPSAKFVYMVRNPVDMIYSFFSQMRFDDYEDATTFEEAWNLQESRSEGVGIPKHCREPRLLRYREFGRLGNRLKVLRSFIPEKQLLVVVYDDFVENSKKVYEDVLNFLGVESDGRENFPVINESKIQRNKTLSMLLSSIPKWVHNAVREAKQLMGMSHIRLNVLAMINAKPAKRSPLSESLRRRLIQEFEPEVRLLESQLGRDFRRWLT